MKSVIALMAALALLLPALSLVSGCASHEPAQYFTLTSNTPDTSIAAGPSIGLRPVEIPEYLRRSAMVRKSANHELEISTLQRWAEPLEDGIRRVMALNLATMLPTKDVRHYPWTTDRRPDVVITLQFLELNATADTASLVTEVEVARDRTHVNSQLISLGTPLTREAGGADIAKAYSQLMRELAQTLIPLIQAPQPTP